MTSSVRKLIDIGANLTDPMFKGIYNGSQKHVSDITHVIKRSITSGVEKIFITGGSLEESKSALEMSKSDEMLYSTVGCHPTRCLEFEAYDNEDKYINELIELALNNKHKVVAVGECGLDYDRLHFCPKEPQLKYFERQIEIAEATGLPLFLHCRNAATDLTQILRKNRDRFIGGVVHSFDGSLEEAKQFIGLGLYIGINGCSLKTESNLEVTAQLPIDRIMIETDSPWCEMKASHAGFKHIKTVFQCKKKEKYETGYHVKGRNEPQNIVQILEVLSQIRDHNIDDLANHLYENTMKLFFGSC